MALSHNVKTLDDETNAMIAEFIRKNGVTKGQPAMAASNEASRATRDLVSVRRKEFRAKNKKGN